MFCLAKKSNFNSDVSEDEESFDNKSVEIIKYNFQNKESGFSSFRDSLFSMFNSQRKSKGNWSIANNYFEERKSKEENNIITQNKKKNRHFLLNDQNDNKETIKHKKPKNECIEKNSLMEYKYKCFCEKINLEGAIWGQLILLKNSVIFFSLKEGRPKDDPIFR